MVFCIVYGTALLLSFGTGTLDLSWLHSNFLPLTTAAIIFSSALAAYCYAASFKQGALLAAGGNTGAWAGWHAGRLASAARRRRAASSRSQPASEPPTGRLRLPHGSPPPPVVCRVHALRLLHGPRTQPAHRVHRPQRVLRAVPRCDACHS